MKHRKKRYNRNKIINNNTRKIFIKHIREPILEKYVYNSCVFSSFVFLTNSLVAYRAAYYTYSLLFFILFITSIIYHNTYNTYTFIIDKISVISIVFYGGFLFFRKCQNTCHQIYPTIVLFAFLYTVFLYYYGYMHDSYCFCKDKTTSDAYHSLMHIITSIGHHCIILM